MIDGACLCGAVRWTLLATPASATACSCTACRRYGALWAYDWDGDGIRTEGETTAYVRGDSLAFHFCPTCGCLAWWRGLAPNAEHGKWRIAVNLRLADPDPVAAVPIRKFDGFDTWKDLPAEGRCVRDLWF